MKIIVVLFFLFQGSAMLKHYQRRDTITQQLFSRLQFRESISTLEQRNVVPKGYFDDMV